MGYKPIEGYGIIGDLHSAALVGSDGSIDWCCLPHFDSPSVFAALLDDAKGGRFRIGPLHPAVEKQMYLADTCVLMTRFLSPDGAGEVIDFMPTAESPGEKPHHQIVRQVRAVRGVVPFRLECRPAFDYARAGHELRLRPEGAVFLSAAGSLGLTSPVRLSAEGSAAVAEFTLQAGESRSFLLRHCEDPGESLLDPGFDADEAFRGTVDFWHRWIAGCRYQGRWRETVRRSALTLKLLTFSPTGAIVAAPTASLPEEIGGARNWDYRYTWIRDAAFTVYALLRLGLTRESERFVRFIGDRAHEHGRDGSLQVLYTIQGGHSTPERILGHLEGYRGSRPVRVGNEAAEHLQLDIYGELMDSIYLSNKHSEPISYDLWRHLSKTLDYVSGHWRRKDEGLWEVRGGRRHFTYSKMMCWVALDRGIRLAQKRSFPGDLQPWRRARDAIYEEIMDKGYDARKGAFVQHYGSQALDASALLMPLVFFISPTDPRMLSTLDALKRELVSDSLVYRYRIGRAADDGLPGSEGTFSICTFWLAEALTRAGRLAEARLIFEKMLAYASPLGLYGEEIGPCGEILGNYPQAFTHLGLVSAAYNLDRALDRRT